MKKDYDVCDYCLSGYVLEEKQTEKGRITSCVPETENLKNCAVL